MAFGNLNVLDPGPNLYLGFNARFPLLTHRHKLLDLLLDVKILYSFGYSSDHLVNIAEGGREH